MRGLDIKVPKIRNWLVRVAEETKRPGFARALLVELLARQMAIEPVRHGGVLNESQTRGGLGLDPRQLSQAACPLTTPE